MEQTTELNTNQDILKIKNEFMTWISKYKDESYRDKDKLNIELCIIACLTLISYRCPNRNFEFNVNKEPISQISSLNSKIKKYRKENDIKSDQEITRLWHYKYCLERVLELSKYKLFTMIANYHIEDFLKESPKTNSFEVIENNNMLKLCFILDSQDFRDEDIKKLQKILELVLKSQIEIHIQPQKLEFQSEFYDNTKSFTTVFEEISERILSCNNKASNVFSSIDFI